MSTHTRAHRETLTCVPPSSGRTQSLATSVSVRTVLLFLRLVSRIFFFAVGIEAYGRQGTEVHTLLYGCQEPGYWDESTPNAMWNCDPNADTLPPSFPFRTTCAHHKQNNQLYQMTLGAPSQVLPANAGFKVGGDTGINSLVLRIHQEHVPEFLKKRNESVLTTTKAGFILTMSRPRPGIKRIALMAVGSHGIIAPRSISHLETAYKFKEDLHIHPIAFMVHTHMHGTAVTGWKVSPDGTWSLIGRRDPQLPEIFAPVANQSMVLRKGDVIAARCTMNNPSDRPVLARYASDQ